MKHSRPPLLVRLPLAFLLVAWGIAVGSCAVSTPGVQSSRSMPAARAALRPEYRIFYDTLSDYGQWVLVEPFGYLYRPRADFNDWRPYASGFWAPSDSYGWVWISSEPYGWATYHYGRWFYDDFQGWVWMPGLDWAPAWVSWKTTDHYAGWAPLGPGNGWQPRTAGAPGGGYLYAALDSLGSTDLDLKHESDLGAEAAKAEPVEAATLLDGVRVPTGPAFERIERVVGRRLQRVKLTDLIPPAAGDGATAPAGAGESGRATVSTGLDEARRMGEQAARDARGFQSRGGPSPARVPIVRPGGPHHLGTRPAARDTSGAEDGGGRR